MQLFGNLPTPEIVVHLNDLDGLGKAYMEVAMSGVWTDDNSQKFIETGSPRVHGQIQKRHCRH